VFYRNKINIPHFLQICSITEWSLNNSKITFQFPTDHHIAYTKLLQVIWTSIRYKPCYYKQSRSLLLLSEITAVCCCVLPVPIAALWNNCSVLLCVLKQPIEENYSEGLVESNWSNWLKAGHDYKITFSNYINRQTSCESAALHRLISQS
jgi:hypothetical protein